MGRRGVLLIGLFALLACRTYRSGGAEQQGAAPPAPAEVSRAGPPGERAPTVPIGSGRQGGKSERGSTDPFADARRRIDQALALEPPPGNYLVRVEKIWLSEGEASSLGALLAYRDEHFDVRAARDIARGGCRILSGTGVVDLSLDVQLEEIEHALLARFGPDSAAVPPPAGGGSPGERRGESREERVAAPIEEVI